MSHHTVLLHELATFLQTNSVGAYKPDGFYAKTERGIVISSFPETPEEVISLSVNLPELQRLQGRTRRLTTSRVQIRTRLLGSPLATVDMLDQLTYLFDRKSLTLGPLNTNGLFLTSTDPLPTKSGGWVQSSNWTFTGLEGLPL